jgi:hypothetical protein
MGPTSNCKYRLVSLHASMLHSTASPVSIFVRFDELTGIAIHQICDNTKETASGFAK